MRLSNRDFEKNKSSFEARTPPSSWYTQSDFFHLEKKTVFQKNWLFAGIVDQLPEIGSYFTGEFMGEPFVVVRGKDRQIRAFYNVCQHHATQVAQGDGKTSQLVCPYHGWTYGLDGTLQGAPRMDQAKSFCKTHFGLKELPLTQWGRLLFFHFGSSSDSISEHLSGLGGKLEALGTDALQFKKRVSYSLKCNWKVYVDNYLDGGYHVVHLHKDLSKGLDLQSYQRELFPRYSVQTCSGGRRKNKRLGDHALYAWIYPNLMLNRYGPILDLNWVIPESEERTTVIFDYFFEPSCDSAFIQKSLEESDQVQREDEAICESVQKGLFSNGYDRGRYAPEIEEPAYHFHQLLFEDLSEASEKS